MVLGLTSCSPVGTGGRVTETFSSLPSSIEVSLLNVGVQALKQTKNAKPVTLAECIDALRGVNEST